LETDRRRVQERIEKITGDLQAVRRHRATQRSGRQRQPLAAGLHRRLHQRRQIHPAQRADRLDALAEDKLFATLDPATRRLRLPTNQNVFLTDTVGFIRKLPHGLVEAFKATLEEVVQAELLLHVVDVSHPQAAEQIAAVNSVLAEIGADGKPTIMVFNKIDNVEAATARWKISPAIPNAVAISAKTGEGFGELIEELGTQLRPIREFVELSVPHGNRRSSRGCTKWRK
jgi:GTPase